MADCLDALIGLSDDDCDCFATGRPVDYNTSSSGLFITDPEHGFPMVEALNVSGDCSGYGVWDILANSRDKAIIQFKIDFLAKVRQRYNRTINSWAGSIGKLKNSGSQALQKQFAGHVYLPYPIKDGKLVVTGLYIGLTTTEAVVPITFSSNDPTFTPVVRNVSSVANTWELNDFTDVELPFYSDKVDELQYYVSYDTTGLLNIKSSFFCCGGRAPYTKSFKYGGFNVDVISEDNISCGANTTYGLAVQGYLACNELDWLCNIDQLAGYEVQQVIARCIQSQAASVAASEVLTSSRTNKYTTWSSEVIEERYNGLKEAYSTNVDWLVDNFPTDASGCFECKSAKTFQKKQILV